MLGRIDLPQFLDADAVFLRLASFVELVFGDELLGQRAARAFGEQSVFAAQLHAARKGILRLAVAADAHVAGGDADDFAFVAIEHFGRGEAGIDFDAQFFGLARPSQRQTLPSEPTKLPWLFINGGIRSWAA